MKIEIPLKAVSVNEAWQGRREIIVYPQVHFVGLGVLERFGSAA